MSENGNNWEEKKAIVDEVRARFPNTQFPTPAKEPVWWGRRSRDRFPGRVAIVDSITDPENPICYAVVSDFYGLRLHEEVVHSIMEVCDNLPEFGEPTVRIALPSEGGKMRMTVTFKEVDYEIKSHDHIHPKIDVFNSYDLGWKMKGVFGAYRLVCSNGMMIGEKWAEFAKRHIESLAISEMVESVKVGMGDFNQQTGLWKKWAEMRIDHDQYAQIWEELPFGEKQKEAIEELPESGTQLLLPAALSDNVLTLWDFNSVVTQFMSHQVESDLVRADKEPKIARVFNNAYRRAA